MKVLLFAPPFEITSNSESSSYPMALCYLGASLEKDNIETKAYNFLFENLDSTLEKVELIVKNEKPDVVGISSMTTNRISTFKIVEKIKKIDPNIKIILGGVHPSIMWEQILDNYSVDYIVLGEGDETIVELVRAIEKSKDARKVKGIVFKEKDKIIKTEPREFIKNLDKLPFAKHEYFEDRIKKKRIVYMITSRGCPIGCNFCSTTLHWGKIRRQRSVENVINEIRLIKKKFPYVNRIYFNDDEFIMNLGWVRDFCEVFIKEKTNIKFECVGRVSSINEETVKILKQAGCTKINFGVESGSQRIINLIGKKITIEQVKRAYKICEKLGMDAGIFLMVGLPGENKHSINETIKILKDIKNAELYTPAIYQVYPGTPTYGLAKRQGFIDDSYWLSENPAPFYTFEHSKRKLLFWSIKISLYAQYYKGNLFNFLMKSIRGILNLGRLRKIFRKYVV